MNAAANMDIARLILVGFLAVLPACHTITEYPEQPPLTKRPTAKSATIHWHRMKDVDAVVAACAAVGATSYGCARVYLDAIAPGWNLCEVWAIEPLDFNDVPKLAIGGHEFQMHCFGAEHIGMKRFG